MNDRFKFRAWYKPNYREPIMLYDVEQTYDYMNGEPESVPADCFGVVLDDKDYIVMQSTGLKDKNGKLIYEGDIVQFPNPYDPSKIFRQVVKWEELALTVGYSFTPFTASTVEVIGNIYTDAHLLEETKND